MNNDSTKLKCTVCEHEIDVPHSAKDGERITCPNCFAQLMIKIEEGKKTLKCAICNNPLLNICPQDCERKHLEKEKRGFFDVKL